MEVEHFDEHFVLEFQLEPVGYDLEMASQV